MNDQKSRVLMLIGFALVLASCGGGVGSGIGGVSRPTCSATLSGAVTGTFDCSPAFAVFSPERNVTALHLEYLNLAPPVGSVIPAGRYRLSDIVHIRKGNLVLRGEGSGPSGTTLYFTRNLMEILGLQNPPNPNVLSWSGGLIRIEPVGPDGSPVAVTAARVRGDNQLSVSSTANLVSGAMVYLRLIDTSARTLWRHVHNDQVDPASVPGLCATTSLHWPVRIATVQGNRVTLAQPLRTDLRMEWVPALVPMNSLSEVGIEHLRIEFPITAYPGHHSEHGFNAIDFEKSVVNSWVRDVEFANADSGVFTGDRCKWITLTDLRYVSARTPDDHGWQGHHGMVFSRTADSLMTRFHFAGKFVHELTVTHQASGNVFSLGDAVQTLALDHHRDWPFENLFTRLTSATEYQDTTGDACEGPSSAARSTFWNLPAPFKAPSWAFIQANSIGALDLSVSDSRTADREWNERVASLEPPDLYCAQLNHRLGISPPCVDGGVDGGNPSSTNGGSNAGARHLGCGGSGVPPSVLLAVGATLRRTWRRGKWAASEDVS